MTGLQAIWEGARLAIGLVVIAVLPGYALSRLFSRAAAQGGDASGRRFVLPLLERCFAVVASSLGVASVAALLLAQLGWFSVGLLIALVGGACCLAWGLASARAARVLSGEGAAEDTFPTLGTGSPLRAWALLAILLLLSAFLFTPPYEATLWAGDATVYLGFGTAISETGAYLADDALLQSMPIEARRELFRNRVPGDTTGAYARFPGGLAIPDLDAGRVAAGFSPLFPVWVALFHQLFGPAWVYHVAPLFGALAVVAVFLVGRSLHGDKTGFIAALLLAFSMPQIFFSRFPMSEVLAQFFLFAALWALHRHVDTGSSLLAGIAGLLLGTAVLARFDLLPILGLACIAFVACSPRAAETIDRAFAFRLVFALLVLLGFAHLLYFPNNYRTLIRDRLERLMGESGASMLGGADPALLVWFVMVFAAVATVAFLLVLRRVVAEPKRRGRIVVGACWAAMALYGLGYFLGSRPRLDETISWLAAYLSWPLLGVFGVCAIGFASRLARARDAKGLLLAALLVSGSIHYLYNPQVIGDHILVMRRFVPIVLPGVFLVVAAGILVVAERFRPALHRAAAGAAAAAMLVLIARVSLPVIAAPHWADGARQSEMLAALFPENAVVLVGPELAGTHMHTTLTYRYGRDAILLQQRYPASSVVQEQILDWLRGGRSVHLAVSERNLHFHAPDIVLSPPTHHRIRLSVLEATDSPPPRRALERTARIVALRAAPREDGAKTAVDVGSYASDALFVLRGFHAPEGAGGSPGESYRWTGRDASIDLPASRQIALVVAGARPEGVPDARLWVWIDDEPVIAGRVVPNQPIRIDLDNPHPVPSSPVTVRIRASVFNPRRSGLSDDGRDLGVRVYSVEFNG